MATAVHSWIISSSLSNVTKFGAEKLIIKKGGQLLLLKGQTSMKNQQNEGPGKYYNSHHEADWKVLAGQLAHMCCVIIFWTDHKTCQLAVPSTAENISHINHAKKNPQDTWASQHSFPASKPLINCWRISSIRCCSERKMFYMYIALIYTIPSSSLC